jgi:hypothetical protein
MHPFANKDVAEKFEAQPVAYRDRLLALRAMIFDVAASTKGVGAIEETLKWDTPSYLTVKPKSGTTIRLAAAPTKGQYGLYVHCQTTLVPTFRDIYPDTFSYEKNRAIIFKVDDQVAEEELRHCISMALTYHLKG